MNQLLASSSKALHPPCPAQVVMHIARKRGVTQSSDVFNTPCDFSVCGNLEGHSNKINWILSLAAEELHCAVHLQDKVNSCGAGLIEMQAATCTFWIL